MSTSRTGRYALLLVAAVALAGCGSTVQTKGQSLTGDGLSQNPLTSTQSPTSTDSTTPTTGASSVVGGTTATTGTTSTGTTSTGTGSSSSGVSSLTSTATGVVSSATGTAKSVVKTVTQTAGKVVGSIPGTVSTTVTAITKPVVVPTTGKGWDKDYVYIGVITQNDVNAVAKQLGLKSIDGGDQEGESTAMANAINTYGGIFGRKIKLVFHDLNTQAITADPETQASSTCAYYAQDHPVVAILSPAGGIDIPNFRACLAKAKIALFSSSSSPVDDVVGQSLAPYFYQQIAPSWNSFAPALVSTLKSQNYFTKWNTSTASAGTSPIKVGVLVGTTDVAGRVGQLVVNALKAQGYSTVLESSDGTSQGLANVELTMANAGVTHMIIPDGGQTTFMLTAASQKYFPRYGLSSVNAPQALLEPNVPAAILSGAVGAGWAPSLDVSDANDPGDTSTAETACRSVYTKAGFDFTGRRLAQAVAYSYCDGLRLMADGAKAGGGIDALSIYHGIVALAPTFKSAFSFGSGLTSTRLAIPGAVRPFAYVGSCSCFRYTSTKSLNF